MLFTATSFCSPVPRPLAADEPDDLAHLSGIIFGEVRLSLAKEVNAAALA
jgi:hypothetical protein